jgi:hypothetical protein
VHHCHNQKGKELIKLLQNHRCPEPSTTLVPVVQIMYAWSVTHWTFLLVRLTSNYAKKKKKLGRVPVASYLKKDWLGPSGRVPV